MAEPPAQMLAEVGLKASVGKLFTVTVTVAVFTQPLASVPVTVKGVVAAGVTVWF